MPLFWEISLEFLQTARALDACHPILWREVVKVSVSLPRNSRVLATFAKKRKFPCSQHPPGPENGREIFGSCGEPLAWNSIFVRHASSPWSFKGFDKVLTWRYSFKFLSGGMFSFQNHSRRMDWGWTFRITTCFTPSKVTNPFDACPIGVKTRAFFGYLKRGLIQRDSYCPISHKFQGNSSTVHCLSTLIL